jgi:tetratricopeptide (TPR) repeat protein
MLNKTRTRKKLTRREQHDLDLEISFMEGVVRRDARFAEAWQVLSEDYTRRGREEEGFKADEHLCRLRPDDPEALYNLACRYSLTGRFEEAVALLLKAVSNGFLDFKWLLRDPDLGKLRKDPLFKKIWIKISAAQAGVL